MQTSYLFRLMKKIELGDYVCKDRTLIPESIDIRCFQGFYLSHSHRLSYSAFPIPTPKRPSSISYLYLFFSYGQLLFATPLTPEAVMYQ
jgi:hypothetical protein